MSQRYLLGIAGCPGAGKSTLAQKIVRDINTRHADSQPAIVVPMDGFHLANEKLAELGLLEFKGIPATFDAQGFVNLLKQLRAQTDENVYAPLFDRTVEASIADAIVIEPKHKVCVVEGNYLLLETEPWNSCRQLLDEIWYLDVPMQVLMPRLLERHENGGRTKDGAAAKVASTDLPNAKLVDATKHKADRIIEFGESDFSFDDCDFEL
jgi:pantothenate kinase